MAKKPGKITSMTEALMSAPSLKSLKSVAALTSLEVAFAAQKEVTFTCTNPACQANITIGGVSFPAGTPISLDPGKHNVFFSVSGSGAYKLTVSGGTLSAPIDSHAPDTGVRALTV
jgi:hypothetical protein